MPSRDTLSLVPRENYWAQRKPRLSFRFAGSFLFRFAERRFLGSLFQEPPRITRLSCSLALCGENLPGTCALRSPPPFLPYPATQQSADLVHHPGHVFVLPEAQEIEICGQSQV